jgi:mRNA-degrading endonuclease HigB of HigAB toxin-antitoxin module
MNQVAMVTINRGTFKLTTPKSELLEVSETHDGVSFNFKNGLQLYFVAPYMPNDVKQLMSLTSMKFNDKSLVFDLENPKYPVKVDMI